MTRRSERFDLEIREHKALSEKTAALQEKIRQDSAKLRSLTVTPDSEPVAGDGMSASSDEAPQPKDTSPPSNAGAQQSEPASPAVPGLPGASTLKKAQQAEQEAKKKASEVLLQAQREAKAKEADAKHATTEVKSATERLEALQRSIKAEQEMLEVANQKADQAQHELSELNAKRQPEIAQNPQAWDALTKQIHEASDRYSEAQKQAQGSRNRLDDLQGQLVSLQQERIAALNEAEETQAAANEAQGKVDRLINPFSLKNIMQWFLDHGPKLLAILIGALILYLTVKLSGRHLVKVVARGGHRGTVRERENRALTLVGVFQNVASLVVVIGGAMMLLDEMGIPIVPLMGGAAVIGLAAAFGAQNLVKDYFSGFMLLLEDQYGLNDVVRIGDIAGVVEGITLRITTLRDLEGVVHFVPHGTITVVSNLTHGWSRALLDIGVAYQEDTDRVMDVMIEVARGMRKDKAFAPLILDNPEMLGVDALGDSAVSIKMVMKTAPDQAMGRTARVSPPHQAPVRRTGHRDSLPTAHRLHTAGKRRHAAERENLTLLKRRQHVRFHLVAVGQRVGHVEQPGDRQHFAHALGREPLLSQRRGVRIDAVRTAVGGRHGQGDNLARRRVKRRPPPHRLRVHERL